MDRRVAEHLQTMEAKVDATRPTPEPRRSVGHGKTSLTSICTDNCTALTEWTGSVAQGVEAGDTARGKPRLDGLR